MLTIKSPFVLGSSPFMHRDIFCKEFDPDVLEWLHMGDHDVAEIIDPGNFKELRKPRPYVKIFNSRKGLFTENLLVDILFYSQDCDNPCLRGVYIRRFKIVQPKITT